MLKISTRLQGNLFITGQYNTKGYATITMFYWFAPGAQSHLHVPGVTRSGEGCLKFILRVTPLNAGELKV